MLKKGTIYIISAPSGTGKTSLVKALSNSIPNLCVSISHTTREKRDKEEAGLDYYFIAKSEFKNMLSQNLFLEHAEVFGNFYGTSKQWVEEKLNEGKDVILEIDWQGARQVRIQYIEAQSIFILPPSLEALNQRLLSRHPDNPVLIEKRFKEAKKELSKYIEYDYLVCNDVFEHALEDLNHIIISQRLSLKKQRETLAELMNKLSD